LDEGDFIGNFFSKLKKIRGVVYRLNKISDTVLNDGNTSQVELIKVLESTAPRNYNITPPELITDDQIRDLTFQDVGTGAAVDFQIKNGTIELTEGGDTKTVIATKDVQLLVADYIALVSDGTLINNSTGIITITLPDASLYGIDQDIVIKNRFGTIVVLPSVGDTIDTFDSITLSLGFESKTLKAVSNNNWIII
jgi:hypothetical protein